MIDQYKEQYKKETEQIHAPADLVARTKAAVREEEARVQRERAAQGAASGMQEISAVQKKRGLDATARKWAYPLTAAAAILVLVSVSMMMRGLEKSGADSASYESGADSGAAESVAEEAFEEAVPEAAFVSEEAPEEKTDVTSDQEAATAGGAESAADETERGATSEESISELEETEDAMSPEQEKKFADSAAESVTIKRVRNKPAFVNRADTELQTYEDMVFQVVQDGDGWIAYVESDDGGGYVIRGEAETMESFLEAGYQRISEISF